MRPLLVCLGVWLASAQPPHLPSFGVTVVDPYGLRGAVYLIQDGSRKLPNFRKLKPVGTVYTSSLDVPARDFREGFPGVTDRYEWFAIDYTGRFWIEKPGTYRFSLGSDDGSRLYIDDRLLINNDGLHSIQTLNGTVTLSGGFHRIRVSYFQGPASGVALVVGIAPPGEEFRVFTTEEFRPPRNPENWKYGSPDDLKDAALSIPAGRKAGK